MRVYLRSHHREELLQPNMQFLKLAYFREEIPFKPQVFPRCQNAEVCLQRLLRYFLLKIVVYMVRLFICGAHNIVIRRKRKQWTKADAGSHLTAFSMLGIMHGSVARTSIFLPTRQIEFLRRENLLGRCNRSFPIIPWRKIVISFIACRQPELLAISYFQVKVQYMGNCFLLEKKT